MRLSPRSAQALGTGHDPADDPQHDIVMPPIPPVANVETIEDGEVLHLGNIALTAHFTPGGTSWIWTACEGTRCLHVVYADSLTPMSEDGHHFSDHPELLDGFNKSFATLNALPSADLEWLAGVRRHCRSCPIVPCSNGA